MKPSKLRPLDYQPPGQEAASDRSRGSWFRFFIGLVVGSVASLIFWPVVWNSKDGGFFAAWFVTAKIGAMIVCFCFDGKREVGAGLLVSLIIGFMIFFGVCAANFKI